MFPWKGILLGSEWITDIKVATSEYLEETVHCKYQNVIKKIRIFGKANHRGFLLRNYP